MFLSLLPSITTVRKTLANSSFCMHEAQFHFEAVADNFAVTNSTLAVVPEDCTSIIAKVVDDSVFNSFVAFTAPIKQDTLPSDHYQTESSTELQRWFKEKQKSTSVNLHMVQPLFSSSPARESTSVLLSDEDVMNRSWWVYGKTRKKGVRMLGFSTDCDPRYLRSMWIASGLFVSNMHQKFQSHADSFKINISSWQWFLLSSPQLCFFMQVNDLPGGNNWLQTPLYQLTPFDSERYLESQSLFSLERQNISAQFIRKQFPRTGPFCSEHWINLPNNRPKLIRCWKNILLKTEHCFPFIRKKIPEIQHLYSDIRDLSDFSEQNCPRCRRQILRWLSTKVLLSKYFSQEVSTNVPFWGNEWI